MAQKDGSPGTEFRKRDDFLEIYANNVQFYSSAWDLRMTVGHVDPSIGPNTVVQEATITIPWPQAKVMLFFLASHVAGQEAERGHIPVPKDVIPELPKSSPPGVTENIWTAVRKVYEEFVSQNPEMLKK